MNKNENKLLYDASSALTNCAKFVSVIDHKFCQEMLDKAQEYVNRIVVDEDMEKEVNKFEEKIRKGIDKTNIK